MAQLNHSAAARERVLRGRRPPVAPPTPPGPSLPPAATATEGSEIRAAISGTARKMSVESLAKAGVQRAFVLDMATVERIVAGAVERALARRAPATGGGETRDAIAAEASGEVVDLIDRARRVRAAPADQTVAAARPSVQADAISLADIMPLRADGGSAETRTSLTVHAPSPSPFLDEVAPALRDLVQGLECAPEKLARCEQELASILERAVARERSSREEVLERRLEKLRMASDAAEAEVERLRGAREEDPGLPSVYKSVQGLAANAPNAARKSALLALVFEENLALRSRHAA